MQNSLKVLHLQLESCIKDTDQEQENEEINRARSGEGEEWRTHSVRALIEYRDISRPALLCVHQSDNFTEFGVQGLYLDFII